MKSGFTVLKMTDVVKNRGERGDKEKKRGIRLKLRKRRVSQGGMPREKHV